MKGQFSLFHVICLNSLMSQQRFTCNIIGAYTHLCFSVNISGRRLWHYRIIFWTLWFSPFGSYQSHCLFKLFFPSTCSSFNTLNRLFCSRWFECAIFCITYTKEETFGSFLSCRVIRYINYSLLLLFCQWENSDTFFFVISYVTCFPVIITDFYSVHAF